MSGRDPHLALLGLAGRAPDGWLATAREVVAAGDPVRLAELAAALDTVPAAESTAVAHWFSPDAEGHAVRDRAAVAAVAAVPGAAACWATSRNGTDRVYLVQVGAGTALPAVAVAVAHALTGLESSPRVEVFGPTTPLPAYHEAALLAAVLLWSAVAQRPVQIARTFDGTDATAGPWFEPGHDVVSDADERQHLLDFLSGGEVVLAADERLPDVVTGTVGAVRPDLRSDGTWVWSDAAHYYLDQHRLAPDAELVAHARTSRPDSRLSPLSRHGVRAALAPTEEDGPLWRAG